MADTLSEDQIAEFKEAFSLFDVNGDGSITTDELGTVMRSLGQDPSEEELQKMVDEVDEDGDGTIDFDEFLAMMAKKLVMPDPKEELKAAFQVFDDGMGFMPVSELLYVLENSAEDLSDMEIENVLKQVDPHNTGRVSFKDFSELLDYVGATIKTG
mmetsp:Transcript_81895/g.198441  ORF Transcript_81895/g.198441 Transcript_81895/m.198441 type:complete len:156 (-) Transcript_81895:38-505(-)